MDIKTLESFKLSDAIKFHDELNPKLWRGNRLDPAVKLQLTSIAEDFLMELGVKNLDVADITVSGSNAAYTYTPHSDLDLHILVDMSKLPNDEIYRELFNAKKTIYNDSHDIKIKGIPIELYVQDSNEPVVSLGEYSILNDKWLKLPTKRRANLDQTAAKAKYEKLYDIVQRALRSKDSSLIDKTLKKIKQYRKAGLDTSGEFGPENLAFKAIRSQGLLTKLYALRDKLHSEKLSIESMYSQNEDYHPNAKPRGPEFKPTMPKGTVRVDVSDVYDWYKLGQHISNLKGLGKHDFGKGPPSTILSFGDEDTEHQYIKDLEKTGLSTTDIDPVDKNQPKGMKRQKVDPTYNVNESNFNKCFDKACKLYDKAVDKGLEPILYQVADYTGDGSNADARWAKLPQHVWSHYVTVIGDTVFDPTAKQFGDDKEEKYSIDKLKSEWNKIYKIRPREMNEAFDKPYPIKWEKSEFGDYDALAQLDDGTYLSIMFNNEFKKNWMVEFYRNNSQEVTGEGDAQRVFATVLTAIGQFIKKKKPTSLFFSAVKEDDPTGSRTKLYDRLVQRFAGTMGYSVQRQEAPGSMSYKLTRIENVKEGASGYIPSNAEKNDPRFKTALTVDIKPDTMKKDAKKFGNNISRAGIPPTLKASGKI